VTYYLHTINPHAGAEFADLCFSGFEFCLTESELPPMSIIQIGVMFPTWEDAQYALDHNPGMIVDQTKKYDSSVEAAAAAAKAYWGK
jgi:hypothetical protein